MLKANNQIENFQLDNGMIVPALKGRLFCSRRDPVKESEVWYRSHETKIELAEKVLVLGLGAGFHLLQFDPSREIFVLELNSELIEIFNNRPHPIRPRIQFISPDSELEASVFEFRPAWVGNEKEYEEIASRFKNRNRCSLQNAAEKKDLLVLAEALKNSQWPENFEISVKEIANLFPLENQTQEAKIWRALRELVA